VKKRASLDAIIEVLADCCRATILRQYRPDCCVATCAILRDVLRHFGYPTIALPVRVIISNPKLVQLIARGADVPSFEENPQWWKLTGAWRMGVVDNGVVDVGKWSGHLVLVQPKAQLVIDASLDQANRPARGIDLPSFLTFHAAASFCAGDPVVITPNGCSVEYQRIWDYSWRTKPDWTLQARRSPIVRELIHRIAQAKSESEVTAV
jgi:hypothetical protein